MAPRQTLDAGNTGLAGEPAARGLGGDSVSEPLPCSVCGRPGKIRWAAGDWRCGGDCLRADLAEAVGPEVVERAEAELEKRRSPVVVEDLGAFLAREIPPRRWLVEGLLQERDAAMVHSWRGVGKSRFAHGLAVAVASGSAFLKWAVPDPRGVLLVDGELPAAELQRMLAEAVAGAEAEVTAPFRVLSADVQPEPLPRLTTSAGQAAVESRLDGVELVILDSVSTLGLDAGRSNDPESWDSAQEWLLSLRRRGVAVLLLHHDGKGHEQRGTSRREDVLAQVLQLRRPSDYTPEHGCRFEVHFRKARGVFGEAAAAVEARMDVEADKAATWAWRPADAALQDRIAELYKVGVTNQREIAAEVGCGLGTVNRKLRALRAEGMIGD